MNFDRTVPSQKFLNFDEGAERQRIYNDVKAKYPLTGKLTCDNILAMSKSIQNDIDAFYEKKTLDDSSGNQRVQNRHIDMYTSYKTEIDKVFLYNNCEEKMSDAESKEFFDTQYDNLERVKGLSEDAGDTTKYLIFGMLGVVVIVAGIIIFKN